MKHNSLIDNVNQLPPGHFLEFNYKKNTTQIYAYWKIPQRIQKPQVDNFEILTWAADTEYADRRTFPKLNKSQEYKSTKT